LALALALALLLADAEPPPLPLLALAPALALLLADAEPPPLLAFAPAEAPALAEAEPPPLDALAPALAPLFADALPPLSFAEAPALALLLADAEPPPLADAFALAPAFADAVAANAGRPSAKTSAPPATTAVIFAAKKDELRDIFHLPQGMLQLPNSPPRMKVKWTCTDLRSRLPIAATACGRARACLAPPPFLLDSGGVVTQGFARENGPSQDSNNLRGPGRPDVLCYIITLQCP
jgi:hypothetical protein